MTISVTSIYEQYKDLDGQPLENGYIYIGEADENPETSPIAVYFDEAATQPAAQPLRTVNGFIYRGGTPTNIFVGDNYSITVRNQQSELVMTTLSAEDAAGAGLIAGDLTVNGDTILGDTIVGGDTTVNLGTGDSFLVQNLDGDTLFEINEDGTAEYPDGQILIEDLSEEVINLILASSGGGSSGGAISSGDGRLSLATGVKVMTTDYTAITTIYYVGGLLLFFNDGAGSFAPFSIGELSQTLASTTYSPAASAANQNYDLFGWKSTLTISGITRSSTTATVTTSAAHNITTGAVVYISGADQSAYNGYQTLLSGSGTTFTFTVAGSPTTPATGTITADTARLSRGPAWRNAGQVITAATNATPIVITANSHGLSNGDVLELTNAIGNTAANGTWVAASVTANTFALTSSVGNGVWTTGGSFSARGVGASTTQIELVNSTYVNSVAITNGPGAQDGTYIGTIHTNGSNQMAFQLGSIAVGGGAAYNSVWNVSNRADVFPTVTEGDDTWTYAASVARPMNNSTGNRISFVRGLNDDPIEISLVSLYQPFTGQGGGNAIALDATDNQSADSQAGEVSNSANLIVVATFSRYGGYPGSGFHFAQALEFQGAPAIGAGTWYGATTAYTTSPLYSTAFFGKLTY